MIESLPVSVVRSRAKSERVITMLIDLNPSMRRLEIEFAAQMHRKEYGVPGLADKELS